MLVTIYTKNTCAPCRMVKQWMNKKGIAFTELSLDDNPDLAGEVVRKSGNMMVPMIQVGDNIVSGPNIPLLSKLLA